jgi:hypothetical protein
MKRGLSFLLLLPALLMTYFAVAQNREKVNTERLKADLNQITQTEKFRNHYNTETLNEVSQFIYNEFDKTCDSVYFQNYKAGGRDYRNVVAVIGSSYAEIIVIGAHYDVCGNQEGADDNASGVVALLELSRMLDSAKLNYQLMFVAYCLEEPPHFRSESMGSYVHAKSLYDKHSKVEGMICFDMIGYFSDEKKSQEYPLGILRLFYGSRGDYITVVRKFGSGKFARKFKRLMKRKDIIRTKSFQGPAALPGIDFSDHLNYWKFGYSAVFITNTAFYRNKNYHEPGDKVHTIDFVRMGKVIEETCSAILNYP